MRIKYIALAALLLSTSAFTPGCGRGNDGTRNDAVIASNSPAPDRPTSVTAWSEVRYSQILPEPPADCKSRETFFVKNDGAWEWNWCADKKTGTLDANDLAELSSRTVAVQEEGFDPMFCMEISYQGEDRLQVIYAQSNDRLLHTLDQAGSCYHGKMEPIKRLEEKVRELKLKYTGLSTR